MSRETRPPRPGLWDQASGTRPPRPGLRGQASETRPFKYDTDSPTGAPTRSRSRDMHLLCIALATTLSLSAALDAGSSSCGGAEPSTVPGCDRVDLGACGNACCLVDLPIPAHGDANRTEHAYLLVKQFLLAGGPDGSYEYVHSADKAGHNPSDNLTEYPIPWNYIFQARHTTAGGYVDTINLNLREDPYPPIGGPSNAVLRIFSVSNIHGALGDNGQNYKNIQYLIANSFLDKAFGAGDLIVRHGCGA